MTLVSFVIDVRSDFPGLKKNARQ